MYTGVHDYERLKELQAFPLDRKIGVTIARVAEFVNHFGEDHCFVSVSGGKDSAVLWDIVHKVFPNVPAVFSDTGLEYPEVREYAKSIATEVVKPKMSFVNVIREYGYPILSKEVSEAIYYARRNTPPTKQADNLEATGTAWTTTSDSETRILVAADSKCTKPTPPHVEKQSGNGLNYLAIDQTFQDESISRRRGASETNCSANAKIHIPQKNTRRKVLLGSFTSSDGTTKSKFNKTKWLPAVYLPYRISNRCCAIMKKSPLSVYSRQTKRYPIIATMACESSMRKQAWFRAGCNAFEGNHISSKPMSFWTEQDVLQYIKAFNLPIASVYGDIICEQPSMFDEECQLCTTGCNRTGCIFCGYGAHLEKPGEQRFLRLKETHPKLYDYALRGGQWEDNPDYIPNLPEYDGEWRNWNPEKIWMPHNGLGMAKVFDLLNETYGYEMIAY